MNPISPHATIAVTRVAAPTHSGGVECGGGEKGGGEEEEGAHGGECNRLVPRPLIKFRGKVAQVSCSPPSPRFQSACRSRLSHHVQRLIRRFVCMSNNILNLSSYPLYAPRTIPNGFYGYIYL